MYLRATIVAAIAFFILEASPARAQTSCPLQQFEQAWSPELQFETRTIGGEVAVLASGIIGPNDYTRLQELRDRTPYRYLLLNSPGGDLEAAVRIAHSAWAGGARVRVPRGWVCGDACILILHSAQVARAEPGSLLYWSPVRRVSNEELLTPAISFDAQGSLIFKKSWGQEVWTAYNLEQRLLRNANNRIPGFDLFDGPPHRVHQIQTPPTTWRNLADIPGFTCTIAGHEALLTGRTERYPLPPLTATFTPPAAVAPPQPAAFAATAPTKDWSDLARAWTVAMDSLPQESNARRVTQPDLQAESHALDLMREALGHAAAAPEIADASSFIQQNEIISTLAQMNDHLVAWRFRGTLAGTRLEGHPDLFALKQTLVSEISRLSADRNTTYPSVANEIAAEFADVATREDYDLALRRVYGLRATSFCPDWSPFVDGEEPPRTPVSIPGGRESAAYGAAREACERGRMLELYSSRELQLMAGGRVVRVPTSYSAPTAGEILRVLFRESAATSAARRVDFNIEHVSGMNEYARDLNASMSMLGQGSFGDAGAHAAGTLNTVERVQISSCSRAQQGGYICDIDLHMRLRRNRALTQLDRLGIFETFVQAINARMPARVRYRFVLTAEGWRSPDMRAAMAERRQQHANAFYESMRRSADATIRAHCAMREAANDIWVAGDPNCTR